MTAVKHGELRAKGEASGGAIRFLVSRLAPGPARFPARPIPGPHPKRAKKKAATQPKQEQALKPALRGEGCNQRSEAATTPEARRDSNRGHRGRQSDVSRNIVRHRAETEECRRRLRATDPTRCVERQIRLSSRRVTDAMPIRKNVGGRAPEDYHAPRGMVAERPVTEAAASYRDQARAKGCGRESQKRLGIPQKG
jgi:hypothetical protein